MWHIKVDGKNKILEMASRTQLTYNLVNPAFDPAQTDNTYTYSFTTPSSPATMEITGYAERMDRQDILYPRRWSATLIVEGIPLEYGFLELLKHTEKRCEWQFVIPGRELLAKLAKIDLTSLSEVVEYTPVVDPSPVKGYLYSYLAFANDDLFGSEVWFEVTINGQTIEGTHIAKGTWNSLGIPGQVTKLEEFADLINTTLGYADLAQVNTLTGPAYLVISDVIIELPDTGISVSGLLIGNDVYGTRSLMAKQEMWRDNFLAANYDDEKNYCWPMVLAPGSAVGENAGAKKLWNMMTGDLYYFHLPRFGDGPSWKTAQYVPQPKIRWILEQLFEKVGVESVIGEVINNEDIQATILFSNVNMSRVQNGPFEEFGNTYDQSSVVPLLKWDLGWTMPEGNGKDFLTVLCDYFGMYWHYVGDAIEFIKKVDQLRSSQENWTSKCESTWIREFVSAGAQILKYKEVDGIPLSETQLLPYGTEGDIVELPANTLPYINVEDRLASYTIDVGWIWQTDFRTFKVPYWIGPAVLAGFENGKPRTNTVPVFVFLFWRGMRSDSEGDKYGLASHDNKTLSGDTVGNLNLDMNAEEDSIYEDRWKDIFAQKKTHKISVNIRLGIADLVKIKAWTNTVKRIYTPLGTILGVVMAVEATFVSDIWQNEIICKVEMGVLK